MSNGVAGSFVWPLLPLVGDSLTLLLSGAEGHPPPAYWSEKVAWRLEEATAKLKVWKEWKPCSVSYYEWTATPYSNLSFWAWTRTFCWTPASPPKRTNIYFLIGLATPWYVFSLLLDEDPTGQGGRISCNRYPAHDPSFGEVISSVLSAFWGWCHKTMGTGLGWTCQQKDDALSGNDITRYQKNTTVPY